jgi:hypothetical protein
MIELYFSSVISFVFRENIHVVCVLYFFIWKIFRENSIYIRVIIALVFLTYLFVVACVLIQLF